VIQIEYRITNKEQFMHILRSLGSAWTCNNYHTYKCTKIRIKSLVKLRINK
jgi:hypothetical protein